MAAVYFDSSVLLSVLLNEPRSSLARDLWMESAQRCSSVLLEAETWIGLKRHGRQPGKAAPAGWFETRAETLVLLLKEITLQSLDKPVMTIVKEERGLADCRALDAIHLATALRLREYMDGGIRIATFDDRMRQTAKNLALEVLPVP